MKKSNFKGYTAALLAAVMTAGMVAGCGNSAQAPAAPEAAETQAAETVVEEESAVSEETVDPSVLEAAEAATQASAGIGGGSLLSAKLDSAAAGQKPAVSPILKASAAGLVLNTEDQKLLDEVSYVMIYNPYVVPEMNGEVDAEAKSLTTGDIASQIDTEIHRAGNEEYNDIMLPDIPMDNSAVSEIGRPDDINRAGGTVPVYSEGDIEEFYADVEDESGVTELQEFECVVEGEHCYVWVTDECITEDQAIDIAENFDEKIYDMAVENFGEPRFADQGAKISLLYHYMPEDMMSVRGYFKPIELFTLEEAGGEAASEKYKVNFGQPLLHFNCEDVADGPAFSVTAHEFQHLICFSEWFVNGKVPMMATWLNEAMSAHSEELYEEGVKDREGYNLCPYLSTYYKNGQSTYNFSIQRNSFDRDSVSGAYGIVHLFSKYITALDGKDVYKGVHEYWRTTQSETPCAAEALISAMSPEAVALINDAYSYPEQISKGFASPEEEWLSKLNLDFTLEEVNASIAGFIDGELGLLNEKYAEVPAEIITEVCRATMLYNEINPVDIQGGGRIIVAVKDHKFEIPADADPGLIYIGLDEDFNAVTPLITAIEE